MGLYFDGKAALASFTRLSTNKPHGKISKERTSVLFYFLSFDAVCKKIEQSQLDLNPDKFEGRNNRKAIELEFTKLSLIESDGTRMKQVTELGKVDNNNQSPEKRISSNFFTVPLKKASEQTTPYYYPKRPSAPLLKMGPAATGLKWGMEYHANWQTNLPVILSATKSSTPFLDLAIFVLRDSSFNLESSSSYIKTIGEGLKAKFSSQLSRFWTDRIDQEKVFAKHISVPFSHSHTRLSSLIKGDDGDRFGDSKKPDLVKYIIYLENALKASDVEFDKYENS